MKTQLLLAFAILLQLANVSAQKNKTRGEVHKNMRVKSMILGYDVRYSVYLPPNYSHSVKHYPVLYLLHGYGDNHKSWLRRGNINRIMDRGIASGEIEPMIIIMPYGKYYWYINDYRHIAPYKDFVFKEFLSYIDSTYRTIPDKTHRAVAGLSMGGYGSLVWAMQYPDKFSSCVALSASMFSKDGLMTMSDNLYKFVSLLYGAPGAKGKDRVTPYFIQNNPLMMAKANSVDSLRSVKWFIDCGNQDQLREANKELHDTFENRNIEHVYHARDGRHNWDFWRVGIYEGLKFVSDELRKQ